jgi:CRISPR system Cascade subunit CasB
MGLEKTAMSSPDEIDRAAVARRWWRALQPVTVDGVTKPGDRAALAHLRRAGTLAAMTHEATIDLFAKLGYRHESRLPRVATLAHVLAHVREDDSDPFASAIGKRDRESKKPVLGVLRFQRLIEANSEDEIMRSFRRAIALVQSRANVADLAQLILSFDQEDMRRRFTFNYYSARLASVAAGETT